MQQASQDSGSLSSRKGKNSGDNCVDYMSFQHRSDLRPLALKKILLYDQGVAWDVDQFIADLNCLTPVKAYIYVLHHGDVLEVSGNAHTIVTLSCDFCLCHYNHLLSTNVRELITVAGQSSKFVIDQLSIDPGGHFEPERWLFEQLNLLLPLVNSCGSDCPGPPQWEKSNSAYEDPRWHALKKLRTHVSSAD